MLRRDVFVSLELLCVAHLYLEPKNGHFTFLVRSKWSQLNSLPYSGALAGESEVI